MLALFHMSSVWNILLRKDIVHPLRIGPGSPQEKSFHNRSHLVLFFDFTPHPMCICLCLSKSVSWHCSVASCSPQGGNHPSIVQPCQPYQWRGRWIRDQKNLFSPFIHTVRLYLLWVPVAQHNATHTHYTWQAFSFVGPGVVHFETKPFRPHIFKGRPRAYLRG